MPRKKSFNLGRSRRFASTRRRFLQGSAAALTGVALSNCSGRVANVQSSSQGNAQEKPAGAGSGKLHIYTWADYTNDELAAMFTEQTGIEVVIDIFDSNETMLAKMQAGGGDAYSVIYPSDYMVQQMIELSMLTKLDQSRLKGMENLLEKWQSPVYDPNNSYTVPFAWGTTGLLYNKAKLSTPPEDWSYLWENKDRLTRQITLLDDVRETMGAVLKSLGYSYNSTDPAELEAAYQKLVELKPAIASFKSFGYQDELLGGDLLLSMSYSVEAISMVEEDENMAYVIPKSGSSIWTDTMTIPTSAPNVDAAYEWINFMLQPEILTKAVEDLKFAPPNGASLEMLSAELKSNEDMFPPEEIIALCEGIAPVGEANDLYDQYWTELTSA